MAPRALLEIRYGLEQGDRGMLEVASGMLADLRGLGCGDWSEGGRDGTSEHGIGASARPFSHDARLALSLEALRLAFDRGWVIAERVPLASLHERPYELPFQLGALPAPVRESPEVFFEVRFVDEVGQPVGGMRVEINAAGVHDIGVGGSGVALLEQVVATAGTVALTELEALDALDNALLPRWEKARVGKAPREGNTSEVVYRGAPIAALPIKPVVPNTVLLKPPLGKLWLELRHADGQKLHAGTPYEIDGPQTFAGTTDDLGGLLHNDVMRGDYQLKLSVKEDSFVLPVVVLAASEAAPQVRMVGAYPGAQLLCLRGFFFDKNKSLPMPALLEAINECRHVFERHESSELLLVGHTDASGENSVNDALSLERAEVVAALLNGDLDAWLAKYAASAPAKHRWGPSEDQIMIDGLLDFEQKAVHEDSIYWYQRTRGLTVDGIAGPKTRQCLVLEYWALAGVSAKDLDIRVTPHGCGENFPLESEQSAAGESGRDDPIGRRLEFFFFDREFGILPPAAGKNSPPGSSQYPTWREQAQLTLDRDRPKAELELTLKTPAGELITDTEVRVMQGGSLICTRRSDAAGSVRISGHDPSQPVEIILQGASGMVTSGGRPHDDSLSLEEPASAPVTVIEGCEFDHSNEDAIHHG